MSQREKPIYDVAVISCDRDLTDLIKLLLNESGYNSILITQTATHAARLMIINLDDNLLSEFLLSGGLTRCRGIIGISAYENDLPILVKSKCTAILHRPFVFSQFRDLVNNIYENSGKRLIRNVIIPETLNLEFNSSERKVSSGDRSILLTPNEYLFLSHLVEKRGVPVSRVELSSLILEGDYKPKSNETDVYICTLRQKLDKTFGLRMIITIRGKGYMIKATPHKEKLVQRQSK